MKRAKQQHHFGRAWKIHLVEVEIKRAYKLGKKMDKKYGDPFLGIFNRNA